MDLTHLKKPPSYLDSGVGPTKINIFCGFAFPNFLSHQANKLVDIIFNIPQLNENTVYFVDSSCVFILIKL